MEFAPPLKTEFDIQQEKFIGRPYYWDLDTHIKSIIQMICADEIETALEMCDKIPAWYRENYPTKLTEIKNTLWKNLYDSYEYSNESAIEPGWTPNDALKQYQSGYFYPRANILKTEIKRYNEQGIKPWVCELSPSHGAMILGLLHDGCEFTYYAQNLNAKATDVLKEWLPREVWRVEPIHQPTILVCYESLEHSYRERDIEQAAKKIGHNWDMIFLSVPYGCLFGGLPNWNSRKLGHVRGYTTKDFQELCQKFFPGYEWEYFKSHSQVMVGRK